MALRAPATRPPLRRIFWALGQLKAGRSVKATDVAREFEVGLRTAYRDIDFLRDSFKAPIEYDRSAATYRLTDPSTPLPAVLLSEGELIALYFAEKVLAQYRGTPFEADITTAFEKIQTLLPEDVTVLPDQVISGLSVDLGPLPRGDDAAFALVVDGLVQRRRLQVRYSTAGGGHTRDRVIDPYRVFNVKGIWYVAAFDSRRKTVRTFALHRIRQATLTDDTFAPHSAFDFDAYLASGFGIEKGAALVNVAIRFSPHQAIWIRERHWHRSARIQERLDGGCVLRMRLAITSELLRWVMQFGADAEVVAPKSLRKQVASGLALAARRYRRTARPAQ